MLCKVCREGLQGIWDPSKTKRVCRIDEFQVDEAPSEESKFVIVETYKTVKPYDPEFGRPEHYMFGHHLTQASFEQSVRDGCVMCDAFKPWHDGYEAKPNPKIAALGYYSLFSIRFEGCPIMFMYVNDTRGGFALSRHDAQDDTINLHISRSTGDDTTWAIIQTWLDNCLQTHPRCNERRSATFVPARLLRLETGTGPEPVFRLVHASEVEPGTRYVTLSHCCGADGLQLRESTLAQLTTPQPRSKLPATFGDALAVVARLGLAHVWIDQLCVLQDSAADQRAAAREKRDVFGNAFLGIAALGAASASSGLFATRDPARVAPTVFNLPLGPPSGSTATVITAAPYRAWLEVPDAWTRAFRDDPLSRSARALHERLLAPRVLLFGSRMVFWECHGACCAEIHPRGVNEALGLGLGLGPGEGDMIMAAERRQRNKPWKTLLSGPVWRMRDDDDPVQQVFADWFVVLETHAGCTLLTVPEERLLGLAGVAADMQRMLRDRGCHETAYLAGMWKAMLPGGLVWNVRGGPASSRPAAYRAPSWSWAAVDGSVNFHDRTPAEAGAGRLLCRLVSASTTRRTADDDDDDETGEVVAGRVVLRGKLVRGTLSAPVLSRCLPGNEAAIRRLVDPDDGASLAEPAKDSPWTVVFDTMEDVGDEVLCLPIRARTVSNIGCHVDGLALSRLDDGCYVRRGKWSILADTEEEVLGIFGGLRERELEIV